MKQEAMNPRFEFVFEAHVDVARPVFIPDIPFGGGAVWPKFLADNSKGRACGE